MGSPAAPPACSPTAPSRVRYYVLAWLCLAALIAYIPRMCLGVAESTIRTDLGLQEHVILGFHLSAVKQMSLTMAAFFLTYSVFQLPAGWLADLWGTRRALTLFALLWSAATGLAALAADLPLLLVSRLAMGAAQAGIFSCTTLTVAQWFPLTRRALANGSLGSFMSIGGAVSALVTGFLLELEVSWRWMFVLYAVPGIAWAVGFYAWFRDRPADHPGVNPAELDLLRGSVPASNRETSPARAEPTLWRGLFTSPAMAWICAQQFFRAAGYMFFGTWFATYLMETRPVSVGESGVLTSLPLWGVVLGSPVGGLVSDQILARTGSRRLSRQGVAIASQLACAVLTLLAYPVAGAVPAVLLISAGAFLASFASPCAYTISIEMGGKHVATVFSLMNMAGNLGAMVFPVAVSWLVDAGGWDPMLFVFAGIYVAAALCWLGVDPRGTVFDRRPASP
jgi:ACS family glucarate transporter-like MFS transporter